MAISTEIVGKTFGPFVRDYTFKDLEICALGCGCAWDGKVDLEYVNERDAKNPDLKVLPIFGVPLTVNEEMTTTLDYGFDYSGSLHYGIDVFFYAPFKMSDHIETFVTQEAIWDRGEGRGSLSKQVGKSYSSDGTHLCTVETYDCCIYDGGFGGEQPPKDVVEYPDRKPDLVYEEVCGLQWPLIYRMMGDWHQQHIDWSYTEQTGVPVKVVTAASGTYDTTLAAELDKSSAPTLFQCGNQGAINSYGDYCLPLDGTAIMDQMTTDSFNLKDEDGNTLSIGYCYEAFGIIVNKALLEKAGYSLDDITNFESLKKVADDIHARAAELGFDAFSSAGLDGSSSWRFSGHLANMPLYYQFRDDGVTSQPATITDAYLDNFKNIWDLYITDSATTGAALATATSDESEAEFGEGKAVFSRTAVGSTPR